MTKTQKRGKTMYSPHRNGFLGVYIFSAGLYIAVEPQMLAAADLRQIADSQAAHEKYRTRTARAARLELVELLHILHREQLRRNLAVDLQRRIAIGRF